MSIGSVLFWLGLGLVACGLVAVTWFVSVGVSWVMESLRLKTPRWLAACIAMLLVGAVLVVTARVLGLKIMFALGGP